MLSSFDGTVQYKSGIYWGPDTFWRLMLVWTTAQDARSLHTYTSTLKWCNHLVYTTKKGPIKTTSATETGIMTLSASHNISSINKLASKTENSVNNFINLLDATQPIPKAQC